MKKFSLLLLAIATLSSACVVRARGGVHVDPVRVHVRGPVVRAPVVVVHEAPPPPRHVVVQAARPGQVWVEGRWVRAGNQWQWQEGYWQSAQPQRVWVQGHWEAQGGGYVWVEGRWQ